MDSANKQAEYAIAMTSLYPPTNQHLLRKWRDESVDQDLQNLITKWIDHIEGRIGSIDFLEEFDKVNNKVQSGFYK